MRSKKLTKLVALVLIGMLLYAFPVMAEGEYTSVEVESNLLPDDVSSSSATSYSRTRGNYLSYGYSEVANEGGGVVGIYGDTVAGRVVDKIYLDLYLDRKPEGGSWSQIDYWNLSSSNVSILSAYKTKTATSGTYYYRVRGVHSVKVGTTTETYSTYTDGIKITR